MSDIFGCSLCKYANCVECFRLLVGAPKASDPNLLGITEPGVIYACQPPFTAKCVQVDIDSKYKTHLPLRPAEILLGCIFVVEFCCCFELLFIMMITVYKCKSTTKNINFHYKQWFNMSCEKNYRSMGEHNTYCTLTSNGTLYQQKGKTFVQCMCFIVQRHIRSLFVCQVIT